jgi:hypothetical protein
LEAFSVKAELDLRGRLVPASDEDFAGVVGQMLHFNLSVTASLA